MKGVDQKVYHIYAKNRCIMASVNEEEFEKIWKTLQTLVILMKTDYTIEDLSYEELTINKETISNSSY